MQNRAVFWKKQMGYGEGGWTNSRWGYEMMCVNGWSNSPTGIISFLCVYPTSLLFTNTSNNSICRSDQSNLCTKRRIRLGIVHAEPIVFTKFSRKNFNGILLERPTKSCRPGPMQWNNTNHDHWDRKKQELRTKFPCLRLRACGICQPGDFSRNFCAYLCSWVVPTVCVRE